MYLYASTMTTPKLDDLEAVRAVIEAVKDFKPDDQHRIFRWAAEKLNMGLPTPAYSGAATPPVATSPVAATLSSHSGQTVPAAKSDIKSFMAQKRPRNDVQFAAATAYYYRFEASASERKDSINKDDLQEAARKAPHERFKNPLQTLNNAHSLGLLDRGPERGTFLINSVGENLVAMTLPDGAVGQKDATKRYPNRSAKKNAKGKAGNGTKRAKDKRS